MTQRNDQVTANVQIGGMINYTPCSIEVGEVTTLPAGSDATVTNSGDDHEVVLDFGIPQGAKGDTGDQGETGKSAYQAAVEAGYEGTEEQFGTSLITIDESATAAAASATAAAASATAASGSATTASNAATTATTKAGEAATSAANAATSASSAGSHATTAQNYATQASTYASNAANSATNAATYASNAASSASNAASMASSASTSASTASAVLEDEDFVAVAGAVEDISTVATNISDVTSVATDIAKVGAVADDLTNIGTVADDLTNIDTAVANLPDLQDKQNKALTNSVILGGETQTTVEGALEALSEAWVKPADWVDISSAALPNSVYFLVSHSADFSTYPLFSVYAEVSTAANTYDVFVDGVKQATTASGTVTTLNWQTLNLSSGWDTTHPSTLRTHIVRVTPTTSTDTLTAIRCDEAAGLQQGVLWVHFSGIFNPIKIQRLVGTDQTTGNYFRYMNKLCEAVTCSQEELKTVDSMSGVVWHAEALEEFPVVNLEQNGTTVISFYRAFGYTKLKRIVIKNGVMNLRQAFDSSYYLKEIVFDNSYNTVLYDYAFNRLRALKKLPTVKSTGAGNHLFTELSSLEETFFDVSYDDALVKLDFNGGDAIHKINGLKGILVSNSAPFTGTSPQINVSYTGLDRAALVRLFNSMPTVSASQVCNITGTTGAADLTAADLAIATNKGWTVTR